MLNNTTMTVDRKSRDALAAAINRYLDGETTAFEFDDEIFGIKSDDPTISHVVHTLWLFYDDCKDHKVQLSKEAWDYIQRLILVLQSDAQTEVRTRRRWDVTQFVAVVALLIFACGACWLGLGIQLLALAAPFGALSIAISAWRSREIAGAMDKNEVALAPFASVNELIPLRRRVSSFKKRKYPPGMKPFKIRSPLEELAVKLQSYGAWLLFSPLVLMFQALPLADTKLRTVTENGGGRR